MSFGFSSRVLFSTSDCFTDGQDDRFDGRDICGLIQLKAGWQPQLSTMKDGIHDKQLYEADACVFTIIKPLLEKTKRLRVWSSSAGGQPHSMFTNIDRKKVTSTSTPTMTSSKTTTRHSKGNGGGVDRQGQQDAEKCVNPKPREDKPGHKEDPTASRRTARRRSRRSR